MLFIAHNVKKLKMEKGKRHIVVQEMKGDVSEVENVDIQAEVEYIR